MGIRKNKKIRSVDIEPTMLEGLRDPEEAAAYIMTCIEEKGKDRTRLLLRAIRDIAKAHGISTLAKGSEARRRALYKALSLEGNPTLETLEAILNDLGLTLDVRPLKKAVGD